MFQSKDLPPTALRRARIASLSAARSELPAGREMRENKAKVARKREKFLILKGNVSDPQSVLLGYKVGFM